MVFSKYLEIIEISLRVFIPYSRRERDHPESRGPRAIGVRATAVSRTGAGRPLAMRATVFV